MTGHHDDASSAGLRSVALAALTVGHTVIPVEPGGKRPVLKGWAVSGLRTEAEILRWWRAVPYNVGLCCASAGMHVLDLDVGGSHPDWPGARGGRDVLQRIADATGHHLPATYTVATPSGGQHLYFRAPRHPRLRSTVGRLGWRIDSRGAGGLVLAPGSRLPTGAYRVLDARDAVPLPPWLIPRLLPPPPLPPPPSLTRSAKSGGPRHPDAYLAAILRAEADIVTGAAPGTRHDTLLRAACRLGRLVGAGELDTTQVTDTLTNAAATHIGIEEFTSTEATATITDGLLFGAAFPRVLRRGTHHRRPHHEP